MAITIGLAKKYLPLLDEVYASESLTTLLEAPANLVKETLNVKEFLIPSVVVDGLGDYDRATGYVSGSATFSWATHTFDYDRGRSFIVDAEDNIESFDLAIGAISGEFLRTKAVPETDAIRFAYIADKAPVGQFVSADLDKDTALQAIDTAFESLENNHVKRANVLLYVSPTVKKYLKQSNLITRQFITSVAGVALNREVEVLDGTPIFTVPQDEFYSEIDLLDGASGGETGGGYVKASGGLDINFILVDPKSALCIKKLAQPRIFSPEVYQASHGWKYDFRIYHTVICPANKLNGIYVHTKAVVSA